jgi:hypothetical protein
MPTIIPALCAQIVPNFRVRIIPVLGTLPAIFGLAAASHVLCALAGQPFQPEPVFRLLEAQYQTQLQRLTEREELVYGNAEGPAVDLDDVRTFSACKLACVCCVTAGAVLCMSSHHPASWRTCRWYTWCGRCGAA